MSKYENYDEVSAKYDEGRSPVGARYFIGIMSGYLQKPLNEIHLLDAGCGTGNYSKTFLDYGIGKISAIDGSEGMLAKAKDKLAPFIDNKQVVAIKQHFLPSIPFPDNHFDIVFFGFVLHHLDKANSDFLNAKAAIKEAYRVLKPGGMLMIATISQKQLEQGMWFLSLLPRTVNRFKEIFMSEDSLLSLVDQTGFCNRSYFVSLDEMLLSEEMYKRLDGPLDANWRQMISCWTLAESEGELPDALDCLRKLKEEGKLEEFFEAAEKKRKEVGSFLTVFAQKPLKI